MPTSCNETNTSDTINPCDALEAAQPKLAADKFKCPHCRVVAAQYWHTVHRRKQEEIELLAINALSNFYRDRGDIAVDFLARATIENFISNNKYGLRVYLSKYFPDFITVGMCLSCDRPTLWVREKMVYPRKSPVDPPNENLNESIKSLYREAALIVGDSPRGAAAILRLALQKLLKQLGKTGENIDSDIEQLVSEGLSEGLRESLRESLRKSLRKSLDLGRVVGNDAVDPGKISFKDKPENATALFYLLNRIAEKLISDKKEGKKL